MKLFWMALLMFTVAGQAAKAGDCSTAATDYNNAISEISSYLSRYTRCLNTSDGDNDCSSEFRRLKYAQHSFESAVSSVRWDCKN